ncbi:MAG: glycosyltransferase [Bacteroidota bacterium]
MPEYNRIINIVDSLLPLNYGIWNAAAGPWRELEARGIASEIWYPADERNAALPEGLPGFELPSLQLPEVQKWINRRQLSPESTLIVTHGAWQYPTRWGREFARLGFQWWYVPHGMLEAWSMNQKKFKKLLYFQLAERPAVKHASLIRAVGSPEQARLRRMFSRDITLIPNGINKAEALCEKSFDGPVRFLFLSRMHHKKGLVPLVGAWLSSSLAGDPGFELLLAGPDQGEGEKVRQMLDGSEVRNVTLSGAVYGEDKDRLLAASHWFVLPSQSEGFPTSVLEAMQYGVIPVISEGCNFPEAIEAGMAIRTGISAEEIRPVLEECSRMNREEILERSRKVQSFVTEHYSLEVIARRIAEELERLRKKTS